MTESVTVISRSEAETAALGRFIGEHAADGLFLALIGDLGTGKTHFVQGLAAGLGIEGAVTSPTFTIMNYYDGALPLKHFDFYRLNDAEELYGIGWDEYGAGGVVVAEWADLFPEVIPGSRDGDAGNAVRDGAAHHPVLGRSGAAFADKGVADLCSWPLIRRRWY